MRKQIDLEEEESREDQLERSYQEMLKQERRQKKLLKGSNYRFVEIQSCLTCAHMFCYTIEDPYQCNAHEEAQIEELGFCDKYEKRKLVPFKMKK